MADVAGLSPAAQTRRFAALLSAKLSVLHGDVIADYRQLVLQKDEVCEDPGDGSDFVLSERHELPVAPHSCLKAFTTANATQGNAHETEWEVAAQPAGIGIGLHLDQIQSPSKAGHTLAQRTESTGVFDRSQTPRSAFKGSPSSREGEKCVQLAAHQEEHSDQLDKMQSTLNMDSQGLQSSLVRGGFDYAGSTLSEKTITLSHMEAQTQSITKMVERMEYRVEEEISTLAVRLGLADAGIHWRGDRNKARRLRNRSSSLRSHSSSNLNSKMCDESLSHQRGRSQSSSMALSRSNYELWPEWSNPDVFSEGESSSKLVRHLTHFDIDEGGHDGKMGGHDVKMGSNFSNVKVVMPAEGRFTWPFVINPNSHQRMVWETIGILTLMFDLITIPLLVFDPPRWTFMDVVGWITLMYWTLDIFASLNVGYHQKNGLLVLDPRQIACHYLKSWFIFDVVTTGIDWASNVASSRRVNMAKVIRIIRISRFLRLMRIMKLMRFFDEIRMRIDSEYVALLLELLQYMAFILAANHFIACTWFYIATTAAPSINWVDAHEMRSRDMLYQYTTSLHWSLTQFTPASMSVQPTNEKERTFAVVVLIFALIIFGSFVSSLTSAMTTLRQLDRKSTGQFWILRKYLRQHMITRDLVLRVIRYLTHSVSRQKSYIEEAQVPVLALLSEPLRDNLRRELYEPSMTRHPFFEVYRRTSAAVMQHICGNCVHEEHVSRGDVLFHHSSPATDMFFLEGGSLIYLYMVAGTKPRSVEVGQYFCEAVLWTPWMHRGEMCAKTECRMVALDSLKFRTNVLKHVQDLLLPTRYAAAFLEILTQMSAEEETVVTDLHEEIQPRMEQFEKFARVPSSGDEAMSTSMRLLEGMMEANPFSRLAATFAGSSSVRTGPNPINEGEP